VAEPMGSAYRLTPAQNTAPAAERYERRPPLGVGVTSLTLSIPLLPCRGALPPSPLLSRLSSHCRGTSTYPNFLLSLVESMSSCGFSVQSKASEGAQSRGIPEER
jgi:hypothetical protein